jgi:CRISPR-associated protein Csb2
MIAAPVGFEDRIDFVRKRLIGRELRWNGETVGILNLAVEQDWVTQQYTEEARCWSSVSPVVLDGFDDHSPTKTRRLVSKALANASISAKGEFEWQSFGFHIGVDAAKEFIRPKNLNGTMIHLRLRFEEPVCGPIALGAGRFRGFGLMAAVRE